MNDQATGKKRYAPPKGVQLNLQKNGTMKLVRRVSDEICALKHSCSLDELCKMLTIIFELPKDQLNPRRLSSSLSAVLNSDNERERALREERVNKLKENPKLVMSNLAFQKAIIQSSLAEQLPIFSMDERNDPPSKSTSKSPNILKSMESFPSTSSSVSKSTAPVPPVPLVQVEASEKAQQIMEKLMEFINRNSKTHKENNLPATLKQINSNVDLYSRMDGIDLFNALKGWLQM